MCAIIGVVGKIPARNYFEKARDSMTHRGPNDAGISYDEKEGVALGHRRLSVIDLSDAGRQPFVSEDGRYKLIFNGEIYNYLELKEELKSMYDFKTETDTEVLLAAYSVWGKDVLAKLTGMFAFAVWDKKERELFCARDRFGIKPFFYTQENGSFYFSSEIKGLRALGIKKSADESIIFDYLYHGYYDHSERTFFEGVRVLRPGHLCIYKNGKLFVQRYWDIADEKDVYEYKDKQSVAGAFKELFARSVKLHFRSDVPVGVNLSSGIDSNALFYYAEKVTGEDIEVFSKCSQSAEYDECRIIEKTLSKDRLKKWHTVDIAPPDFMQAVQEMNRIQGEPYGGIPTIAYRALNELAKDSHVTVLLEGQGGDELLAGYKYYLFEKETTGISQDMTQEVDESLLDEGFVRKYKGETLSFEKPFDDDLLNAQYRDLYFTKLPRVLRFNDHASMAYSRELRVPYLEHKLASFLFHLPRAYKIRGHEQKVLIRDVMRGLVPEVIKNKPKKAFGAIQTEWFRKHYKDDIVSVLNSGSFRGRPFWNHKELMERVNAFFKGDGNNSFFIWQCVNLELWFRKFID